MEDIYVHPKASR